MVYICSDIHGNERRFSSVLRQIRLQEGDTLYVLGDVVDRHPGGIRILRRIMSMPNAKMLLGNHEYMMLRALGFPYDHEETNEALREKATAHWYRNGGKVTHDHWKRIRKTLRREILDYLLSLPLSYELEMDAERYKLVHGAPEEEFDPSSRYKNAAYFAVWKRWEPEEAFPEDYTMIFGHTPTRYYQDCVPMEIWRGAHSIGIDCGSGYPEWSDGRSARNGRLACLRLDDGQVFYSEEDC